MSPGKKFEFGHSTVEGRDYPSIKNFIDLTTGLQPAWKGAVAVKPGGWPSYGLSVIVNNSAFREAQPLPQLINGAGEPVAQSEIKNYYSAIGDLT